MKKVLHISKYYYPFIGGIEQTARDCVNVLKGKYEQKVLCFNHLNGELTDQVDNVEIVRCACQAKISSQSISLSMGKVLRTIISDFRPDYILLHYPNPFVSAFLLRYIPRNVKLILYWHLDITKQKILGKVFHTQNLALIKRADQIIATSPNYISGSKYLVRVKEKCIVVPSCINEERLELNARSIQIGKEIREKFNNKIICLGVGRHVPYKGFEYLIEASKKLDDRFVVFLTGKGELTEKLKKLAGSGSRVQFLGAVDDDNLKALFNVCDIFCFPSITKNEAFGLALAEAMYFNKPAVTFTIPGSGVNYVNLNRVSGIEIPNRDVDEYAKALIELADDIQLRKQYGIAAGDRVRSNFLYKQYRDNIIDLFDVLN